MWPDPTQAPGGLGALVKPVYHVWGKFQTASGAADPGAGVWRTGAGIDGTPYKGEDGAAGGAYWIRQLGSPKEISVTIPGIREGWYEINVEGSLTTDMPSLLSLSGNGTFNANDTDPNWMYIQPGGTLQAMGVSLRGQPKFNGALIKGLNGSRMGVQGGATSLISFEGPQQSIEVGEYAEFSWQFNGLGNTTCTIDGLPEGNDPLTGQCRSPLRKKITDTRRHTLAVTLSDVCGVTRRDTMNFSVAEGWTTSAATNEMGPGGGDTWAVLPLAKPVHAPAADAPTRSAAAAATARGAWAVGLAAFAAAALLY
ncbi:hypothetical protein MNEG_1308 [Monoraphidium neglectum]|uniref:Uncharacterized protein n=1 Tax=Monoraphidium neglectum TaxID=145388 RepID=A0A0D2MVW5_9CHLO|nr:hypothetical protein MNEG_1308 [Monoraphidium neglectum]KIZ06640.1 hypothetical protein MNEG_1308 [Monoraphidium neglectum]|eukprot:XP_013905659.1 hypothetical protein MNEG_1308 [Monoraphidium neglectum]